MRTWILAGAAFVLAACAAGDSGVTTTSTLTAADAATSLIAGESLTLARTVAQPSPEHDAIITLSLRHADGRVMRFTEANHAPDHLRAQAVGGPLAQVMGLFGEEQPLLYAANGEANAGAPFICGPDGPAFIGLYQAADGAVQIAGLRQGFEFETLSDGSVQALPFSPDQVCARLRFRG